MTLLIPKTPMVEQYLNERSLYRAELIAHELEQSFTTDKRQFDINDKFNEIFNVVSKPTVK